MKNSFLGFRNFLVESINGNRKILVIGYPRSGTTWAARLVAELLDCPVAGFWHDYTGNALGREPAIEGKEQKSDIEVFKAHQKFRTKLDNRNIVFIVRDVRDIALSAKRYFKELNALSYMEILGRLHAGCENSLPWYFHRNDNINFYFERNLFYSRGREKPVRWLFNWNDYINVYLERSAFFLRYEDLLANPFIEAKRVLKHLNVVKSDTQVQTAILKQSFEAGQQFNKSNLSIGKSRQYETLFSDEEKAEALRLFGEMLARLNYPTQ